MNDVQLVIPMSGSGKRFVDAGYTDLKPLIEVDGEPMLQHVLRLFPGVTDVVFICNKDHLRDTDMAEVIKRICPLGKIVSIDQHKLGPVYAVAQAFDALSDTKEIIVSYCDYGTNWDFGQFLLDVRTGDFDGALACYRGFHPHMLGSDNYAFCREQDNVLLEIKEKEPFTDDKMSEFASNGTYYFKSGAILKKYFQRTLDLNINVNGEHYVSLVYNLLVADGLRSLIFEIDHMLQWGTPYDLEVYNTWSRYFANKETGRVPEQDFTLILPMSGKGSRFSQEGYELPKPLIPVDDVPMVIKAVDCLPKHKDATFICLKEHTGVEQTIKQYYPDAQVRFIDAVTEGQACTCEIGIDDEERPILISACDNGALYNEQAFVDMINDTDNDVIVWSFTNNQTSKINPDMYAWLDVDEDGFIRDVSCKKFVEGRTHAIIGTMYFRKAQYFLEGLRKNRELDRRTNGEFYVDDVLNQNIDSGLNVKVFEVDHYVCWGTPDDYKTYNYWRDYFNVSDSRY